METKKLYSKPQLEVHSLQLGTLLQEVSIGVKRQVLDEYDATEGAWARKKSNPWYDDDE